MPGDPSGSGHLIRDLVLHYQAKTVADPAEGSGTTGEVCRSMGISYQGFDLREGFDLGSTTLKDALPSPADFVFLHPPYYRIIRYSGNVWGTRADKRDLSHENDWPQYLARLRAMVGHARAGLTARGHLAVLIGDIRERGRYYSAQAEFFRWFTPAEIDAVVIKAQHHVRSETKDYGSKSLIRIEHETCVVVRANGGRHA